MLTYFVKNSDVSWLMKMRNFILHMHPGKNKKGQAIKITA